jgi:hypothetical protein
MDRSRNWAEQMEIYRLQEEVESLKNENNDLKKKNAHFKSTKAYNVWMKYVGIKNKIKKRKEFAPKAKRLKDIKVAMIVDEFTFNCFKHEFHPIPLTPKNWKKMFEQEEPDLFFCESAWRGYDGVRNNLWRYKIPLTYFAKTKQIGMNFLKSSNTAKNTAFRPFSGIRRILSIIRTIEFPMQILPSTLIIYLPVPRNA